MQFEDEAALVQRFGWGGIVAPLQTLLTALVSLLVYQVEDAEFVAVNCLVVYGLRAMLAVPTGLGF